MRRKNKIFWTGFLIYTASFFLQSVDGFTNQPTRGWFCAFATLIYPWAELEAKLVRGLPFVFSPPEYVSILIAGLINPIFLFSIFLSATDQYRRLAATLKVVLLLMVPFCWIFFYLKHLHPLGGHFLWIFGMLVTIFSYELSKIAENREYRHISTDPPD